MVAEGTPAGWGGGGGGGGGGNCPRGGRGRCSSNLPDKSAFIYNPRGGCSVVGDGEMYSGLYCIFITAAPTKNKTRQKTKQQPRNRVYIVFYNCCTYKKRKKNIYKKSVNKNEVHVINFFGKVAEKVARV